MNENGITDVDSQKSVLTRLVNQEASKIVTTNYNIKDLNIAKIEDKISLKKYGNDIAPTIGKVFTKKVMVDDITNINLFLQNKDISGLSGLTQKRIWVDGLIKNLLSISVPPSATMYHLLILNRITMYRDNLDNLSKADTDPIRARIAIDQYTQVITLIFYIPNQLHNYFDEQNIVFSSKDAGYLFTVGYNIIN
jgi:hypothetical protein